MSDFWLHCDNCKRTDVGVTWVNGFRFCAKCYQETFGNTNPFEKELTDKIADLEAKLAESEEYEEMLLEEKSGYIDLVSAYADKCKNYNKQLTEKDKEILDVKNWWSYQYEGEKQRHNQDKISFCIEQFEIVKDLAECVLDNAIKNCSLNESYYDRLLDEIDNQIKQLKEMK